MPPEKEKVLRQWLNKAREDLSLSEFLILRQPQFVEAAAFHAQ
jgi:hypothetical protein